MSQQRFDAFTRQAAEAISRRRSLAAMGGAGAALAAGLAGPLGVDAKKSAAKKAKKKCKKQVGQCRNGLEELCESIFPPPNGSGFDSVDCFEAFEECCEFLKGCKTAAAFSCAVDVIEELRET
jgi:hypothetical protein